MQALNQYLTDNKLTQAQFAGRVDATQATISRLCSGTAFPSRDLMVRIERETGGAVPILSWFPQEAAE